MSKSQRKIEILPDEDHTDNECDSEDDEDVLILEKPVLPKKDRKKRIDAKLILEPVYAKREERPKKPRTPAQIAAWEATIKRREEVRQERIGKRKEIKQSHEKEKELARRLVEYELNKKAIEEKKKIEEKLVKKAVAIKKKALKKQALLDEISDDDDSIDSVKEKVMVIRNIQRKHPPSQKISSSRYVFL